MKKKILAAALSVIIAAVSLTACGNSSSTSDAKSSSTPDSSSSVSESTADSDSKTETTTTETTTTTAETTTTEQTTTINDKTYIKEASPESNSKIVDLGGTHVYSAGNNYYVKLKTNISDYIQSDGFFDFYKCAADLGYYSYNDDAIVNMNNKYTKNNHAGAFYYIENKDTSDSFKKELYSLQLTPDTKQIKNNVSYLQEINIASTRFIDDFWTAWGDDEATFSSENKENYSFYYKRDINSLSSNATKQMTIYMTKEQVVCAVYALESVKTLYFDYTEGYPTIRSKVVNTSPKTESADIWGTIGRKK